MARVAQALLRAVALVLLVAPRGGAEEYPQAKQVDAAVEAALAREGIPGLSLAVVQGGALRYARGYGFADLENQVPASEATVYRLGSVSKTLTAAAALELVEAGKLDLDAPVQRYVPSFPEKPWPVTTRQLLCHQSGIRNYKDGEMASTRHYASLTEALEIFKADPLAAEPGTEFLYTTYGYTLLGCVIEAAAGTRFADYVRERVFVPSGMASTREDDVYALIPHRAQGYERLPSGELRNSAFADTSYKIPGGGFVGTAPDLARFSIALESGVLVKPETLALMCSNQKTKSGKRTGYGLGLALDRFKGQSEVFHTGGQQKVSTIFYARPERHLCVVLLSNLEGERKMLLSLARSVAELVER